MQISSASPGAGADVRFGGPFKQLALRLIPLTLMLGGTYQTQRNVKTANDEFYKATNPAIPHRVIHERNAREACLNMMSGLFMSGTGAGMGIWQIGSSYARRRKMRELMEAMKAKKG